MSLAPGAPGTQARLMFTVRSGVGGGMAGVKVGLWVCCDYCPWLVWGNAMGREELSKMYK